MFIPENREDNLVMNKRWVIYILILLPGILFSQNNKLKELRAFVDIEQGNYRAANDTLDILLNENPSSNLYLAKARIPKDPWGREYLYLSPGVHDEYDIISYGADGAPGGEGKNKDVNSWELE